jgi:2-polyprenyl-3-methyl-5-hydroxy-6-metoxy-1,4-benzoquinol methylase
VYCSDAIKTRSTNAIRIVAQKKNHGRSMLYAPPELGDDAASVFFELANARAIKYKCQSGVKLKIEQDSNIKDCTGGIVWETALLLATYLEGRGKNKLGWCEDDDEFCCPDGDYGRRKEANQDLQPTSQSSEDKKTHKKNPNSLVNGTEQTKPAKRKGCYTGDDWDGDDDSLRICKGDRPVDRGKCKKSKREEIANAGVSDTPPKVLEVGAGCGLLGLVIAHMGAQVLLTEAAEAMEILTKNVNMKANLEQLAPGASAKARKVDWTSEEDIRALEQEHNSAKFDVVVGTDVIFKAVLVRVCVCCVCVRTLSHR